jgi:hypothetical protein
MALNWAQPTAPPALETITFVVEAVPETVRAVVEAYGNCDAATVELEKNTPLVQIEVVVAPVEVEKLPVPNVKSEPPEPPVPHASAATPTSPSASTWRHRVEPTAIPEMTRFVVEAVLDIVSDVEDA